MSFVSDRVATPFPLLSTGGAITWDLPPNAPSPYKPPPLDLHFSRASCLLCVASFLSGGSSSVITAVTGAECK